MTIDSTGSGQPERVIFSKGRDLDQVAAVLPELLERMLPGAANVRVGVPNLPVGAGRSNETVLFDATYDRDGRTETGEWVLRIAPNAVQLFIEPNFRMQYELMVALRRHGSVKVPEILLYDDDPTLFGQPFFIMERVRGKVPVGSPPYSTHGWLYEAAPAQRRIVWETAIEQLTRIHNVPLDVVDCLPRPAPGQHGLDALLAYWRRSLEFSAMGQVPDVFPMIADWLEAHRPADHVDGLAWGDARMGNMMFGDDFRVRTVLDWEQASRGGGLCDLGWWLFFDAHHSEGLGVARLDGLGTRQETLDYWEQQVGRSAANITWYEVLAGYSVAQVWLRNRLVHGDTVVDAMAANTLIPRTLDLMGTASAAGGR